MSLDSSKAIKVLTKGRLFYPATAHYPDKINCVVGCDYCGRSRLSVSVGYKKYDLCLSCAERVAGDPCGFASLPTLIGGGADAITMMVQDSVRLYPMTRMMQDSVRTLPFQR